jgi:arginine decarboxylase
LNEEPTRRGVLADITCDSDGKVDQFIDLRDVKSTLELHPFKPEEPYLLGAFLIGAYQEILGDLHNLLGDSNAVHVSLNADGQIVIDDVIKGDTVNEVLRYVQYDPQVLLKNMLQSIERAVRANLITVAESGQLMKFYEDGLDGYTYLE